MSKVTRLLSNSFLLATKDLANQYALPVQSLTGNLVSRYTAMKSRRLNQKVIKDLKIGKDDYIFEIGFGRGDAMKMCFDVVSEGNGMVFGVERSGYMDDVTRRRFDLEIAESAKIRIDSAIDLRNLPYPSDLFDQVFHVDVFYFWRQENLVDINKEILRVLKPGAQLKCGMRFNVLKQLSEHRLLETTQWDPVRYLTAMEEADFQDVKIEYHQDSQLGEYQILTGKKSEKDLNDEDPDEILRKLAMDMKRERLAIAMMNNKKDTGDE